MATPRMDITSFVGKLLEEDDVDLLREALSRERQVIVFSQEADVLAWAEANLREPQDHIEGLEVVGVA